METVLPGVPYLDCVDRLLYPQELCKPDYLPILGHSALEQILSPSSSEESSCSSLQSSGFCEMERMSPDSTVNPVLSLPQNDATMVGFGTLTSVEQPDSTTNDLNSYDSDAFDSEDSVSSFADVQEAASGVNSSLTWPIVEKSAKCEIQHHRRERRSTSSSSSGSYSDPVANRNFGNASMTQKSPIEVKPPKKKKTKRQESTVLKCQCCEYTTRYKEHLSSHMNTHASDRNYMCSDCGQTFKWSHSLKRHQRTHQTHPDFRYTCHFCFKTFSRKDHLTIHEDLHTTSGETFPCNQCRATFKNRKTLTGHMKTHTSQKDFKCNECDSEFTRRASLNRHIRAAHAGQVITCPLCPAVFSYRSTLEDHKKAAHNEGKREFGCSLCGVQFAVKAYLSKHMVTCRNRAVGRSYECSFCTKCFPTVRHLNEHSKRKHPAAARQPNMQRLKAETKAQGLLTPDLVQNSLHQSQQVQLLPQIQQLHPQPQQEQILTQQPLEPQSTQTMQQPLQTVEKYQPVFMEISNQVQQHESSDILLCQPPQPQPPHQISQVPNFQMNNPHQQIQDCFMFSSTTPSGNQSRSDVALMANPSSMASPDEENVGSLLRLVYGCSDQSAEQDTNSGFVVTDQSPQYHYNNQNPPNMNQISQTFYKQPDNSLDYQSFEGISLDYMKNYFVTISYDSFE